MMLIDADNLKVNLAIRTACSCNSYSPSSPPSSCWLGTAAPLIFAAPPSFIRCQTTELMIRSGCLHRAGQRVGWCQNSCWQCLSISNVQCYDVIFPLIPARLLTWHCPWVTMKTADLVRGRCRISWSMNNVSDTDDYGNDDGNENNLGVWFPFACSWLSGNVTDDDENDYGIDSDDNSLA